MHRPGISFVADDFGESPETNAAIARLCSGPVVRSVTVLGGEDACTSGREQFGPDVVWGAHLYLTERAPLSSALKRLSRNGQGLGKRDLFLAWLGRRVTARDLYAEFAAQVARLRQLGFRIAFLDTHQNVHGLPFVLPVVRELAKELGLADHVRPIAQLEFSLKGNSRTLFSGLYSRAAGFRPLSRVVVGCPGYRATTLEGDRALEDWDRFLSAMGSSPHDLLAVPCHPGVSPAEAQLYASERFVELLDRHEFHPMAGV